MHYSERLQDVAHRKWREIKQQLIRLPDLALLGCSLLSLHILCDILQTFTVGSVGCFSLLREAKRAKQTLHL